MPTPSLFASLLLLLLPLSASLDLAAFPEDRPLLEQQWMQWKTRYGKTYPDSTKESEAHALWLRHWHLVQSHNNQDDVSFTLEMNAFADQEPSHKPHTEDQSHSLHYVPEVISGSDVAGAPPSSFDWRTKGAVSPVKNQGQMGSADAFAVTEDLESLHFIHTGQLVSLSVQEVVDCCSADPGGHMLVSDIYECIARHGGLCSDSGYPAHMSPSGCHNNSCQAVAKDATKTVHIPKGGEKAMVAAILGRPLVVLVDAGHASFQLYRAGVYREKQCRGDRLDHAMQLVGYGTTQGGVAYWILKNSWGSSWGMQGYIWMERGVNMCGIANDAMYPE